MDLGSEKTCLITSCNKEKIQIFSKELFLQYIPTTNTQHRNYSNYLLALISCILASEGNFMNFNVNMQNS